MLDSTFIQFPLDYEGTKNLPIGECAAGQHIFTGGCTWTIACYPRGNGMNRSNGEYLSILVFTNSRNVVNTAVHIFLIGRDGATSFIRTKSSGEITAGTRITYIWWHRFMKRSEIESGGYLVDDGRVTFGCGIIDLNGNRIPVPPSDLGRHLGLLLHFTDVSGSSDVSFSVGGETFRAHRAIVAARSPVLKSQLFGSVADDATGITLHDVQPAAFRILLRFLYTDTLPTDTDLNKDAESSSATVTDLLQHILAAADMAEAHV